MVGATSPPVGVVGATYPSGERSEMTGVRGLSRFSFPLEFSRLVR
jgi:hypothetical protein